jgi:hypothetical protein
MAIWTIWKGRAFRLGWVAALTCGLGAIATGPGAPRLNAQGQAGGVPTFTRDVAPIFYKNCTNCHRPGEIAPMSLLTFKDARPWAKSIATRVSSGLMPPWHADPAYGHFLNDRRLSDADRDVIARWANGGAPEGNAADLPPQPTYEGGWSIGQPDEIYAMQEDYPITATGTIAYQYFEIPTNLTEDRWIQAFEVKAGNPAVLHHVIVYARPPAPAAPPPQPPPGGGQAARPTPLFAFAEGMEIPAGQTGGRPLPPEQRKPLGPNDRPAPRLGPSVGGFAPGQFVRVYQEGTAMKLPAGSTLIFQVHYTAIGKVTTDRTRLGVRFAKTVPRTELRWASLANGSLHIPAGDPNHRVDADMTIGRDITLWSMLPHTHVRGKGWTYEATYPDGRKETILSVPKYDFNWQTDYVFREPLKLPKGTRLHATAWYDNSAANKANPDPTKDVWWGDQTWEEMMFTGLTFSIDNATPAPSAGPR